MIKVVILGTGNVARHLCSALHQSKTVDIIQLAGRNRDSLSNFSQFTRVHYGFENLLDADVYLIAIRDEAIGEVSESIASKDRLIVHTSGSTSLNKISSNVRRGVFYPLQTFSSERSVKFEKIPICLEAENERDYEILEKLARNLSKVVMRINSQQRSQLHMAAVFVNNFTNHLFQIGQSLCEKNNLPFEILQPLIEETVLKLNEMNAYEAQTGPARRGDLNTLKFQLESLDNKMHQKIYKVISESIQKTYAEKL